MHTRSAPVATLCFLLCLGWLLVCSVFAPPLWAQDDATIRFAADSSGLSLSFVPWRFHAGDDTAWASPDYDDTAWPLIAPTATPDSLMLLGWQGIGWYRITIDVDSVLARQSAVLNISQHGATEFYLNGRFIHRLGRPHPSRDNEQTLNAQGIEIVLSFDGVRNNVLAVRYSNSRLAGGGLRNLTLSGSFEASLHEVDSFYRGSRLPDLVNVILWGFGCGVFALMFLIHFILYFLADRSKENLLLSIYALIWVVAVAGFQLGMLHPGITSPISTGLNVFIFSLLILAIIPFVAALHYVYYDKLVAFFWPLAAVTIAGAIYVSVSGRLDPTLFVQAVGVLEIVRTSIVAIRRGKEGGWIVLGGSLVFAIGIGIEGIGGLYNLVGDLLIILGLPSSVSLLLGLRFARQRREIARHAERLELQVEERTADLSRSLDDLKKAQDQLVHSEKMASLGSLTAGIAHEIKNPLNFINNFAEVNVELADELREAIANGADVDDLLNDLGQNAAVIAEHGKRADGIVRSMMQHARGGTGEKQLVDLNTMVKEYVDLAYNGKRAQVPDFDVEIAVDFDPSNPMASLVPDDIGRVLINLVGNAFDAVRERAVASQAAAGAEYEPHVTIMTRKTSDGYAAIRIADNGNGVPEAIRAKIFEPFFTTKPTGSGTGIGLSLTHDIVTKGHGGSLRVEPTEGGGATFVVMLPLRRLPET